MAVAEAPARVRPAAVVAVMAVVEAWDAGGHGVRAVVTSGELAAFVAGLIHEACRVGADYGDVLGGNREVPSGSSVNPRHTGPGAIIDY